jgi:hypothetical protein
LRGAIERRCSIGEIMLENCRQTSSDLKTRRVAIARFRIIRARFDKLFMPAFSKADHRSISETPLLDSNIDEICFVCSGATT